MPLVYFMSPLREMKIFIVIITEIIRNKKPHLSYLSIAALSKLSVLFIEIYKCNNPQPYFPQIPTKVMW